VTVERLQEALRQRDETIAALEKRVAALEATSSTATLPAIQSSPAAAAGLGVAPANGGDEELQALSRGLVQQGLLVLPKGTFEVSPSLAYSHSQEQGLVLVDTPEGISVVSDQRRRQDALEAAITARYGLPWNSQIQLRVPYAWRRDESALGDGTQVKNSDTHIGDVEIELAHQLVTERHGMPGITAAVAWRIPTGSDAFNAPRASVATGTGSHQLSGRLSVIKSLDPIVAFGTLSYAHTFSRHEDIGKVDAGDAVDLSLGALLAVSPETSINVQFSQQFRGHTSVDGMSIPGSDGVAAVAQFGIDQLLGSRALLSATLGIGLTNDAPDYQFMISAPIRFR
jgi:hypothetical protein